MDTEHEAWLTLTREDPIDPDLPICDPHHHFWDRPNGRYFLEDLLQDTGGGHNVVQTVFVECGSMYRKDGPTEMQPVGETEFVQGIALSARTRHLKTNVAAGIVGYADLTLGAAVVPVLEAHFSAGRGRFRGIRYVSSWDACPDIPHGRKVHPPQKMLDPKFRRGFACLHKYSLSFDAYLFHPQLLELVDLARAFPDTPIILNHTGGLLGVGPYAGKRVEVFQDWKRGIAALATCPNVVVKLGGLGNPIRGFGWNKRPKPPSSTELAEAMAPYYQTCIEQFRADRCMFESNFPVDKISYSYTVMWNAFKRMTADYSPDERAALFHDTAAKAYRLATINP